MDGNIKSAHKSSTRNTLLFN